MNNNNDYDYVANMKYLLEKKIDNTVSGDIQLQDNVLDSKKFNTTMKYIEDSLNFLYEKNRMLEDTANYIEQYINNEINNNIKDCQELLKEINNDRDIIKNNSYIKFPVPFISSTISCSDRDNTAISSAVLYNNNLMLASNLINDNNIETVEIIKPHDNNAIEDTLNKIKETKNYRTAYMFNMAQSASVTEILSFYFSKPIKINVIDFTPSNCIIDNITVYLEDDTKINLQNNPGFFKTYVVKKIDITIECNNYVKSQVNFTKEDKINGFWDIIGSMKDDDNAYIDKPFFYYYLFGIDDIKFQYVKKEKQSCFISKEIKIDKLKEHEYLTLRVKDSDEESNIEYYIIDGTNQIPINPENKTKIIDEKLFYKMPLRFTYNKNKPIIVKKNNKTTTETIEEALNKNSKDSYTVSYTPISTTINSLTNDKIKIKAIIRNYNDDFTPFINDIKIIKYGGGKLCIDQL